jgi:predicted TIM-barrel fold metal-dependent hydrolase
VLSADSHIVEPPDAYVKYIDPEFKDRAPQVRNDPTLGQIWRTEELTFPNVELMAGAGKDREEVHFAGRYEAARRGGWDADERLKDMDITGVAAALLYPTIGFHSYGIGDPKLLNAVLAAWNSWIADFCKGHEDRLWGVGCVALDDVDVAIEELERCKKLGFPTVNIPLKNEHEPYNTKAFDRFWAAAQDLEMPLSTHTGSLRGRHNNMRNPNRNRELLEKREGEYWGTGIASVHIQTLIGELLVSGVFDRFPKLRVIGAEFEAGWAAFFLEKLDDNLYNHRARYWVRDWPMKPSDYFRRNMALTFIDDRVAVLCREIIGVDNLMWSDDYPHIEASWPDSARILDRLFADVPPPEKQKIVGGNLSRIYKLLER